MSETTERGPQRRKMSSTLKVLAAVLVGILILASFIPSYVRTRQGAYRVRCLANLHALGAAMSLYREEHGSVYPGAEHWCDLLVGRYVSQEFFQCRRGEGGCCDYAMNPLADPCSAGDVVLLFECGSGWNRFGGAELLAPENHQGKGCNILFADLHSEFVKTRDFARLRWTYEDRADVNLPRDARNVQ